MSRLLINEHPLQVLPTLATKIGLNEAIVLQQIHYWNDINKKANNNFRDGYYWTFNSYEEWTKQFPFWSARTIQRAIKRLEDLKLVVSGNYNKLKIDRTKWYRIDILVVQELETSPFGQSGTINMTDWLDHLDKMGLPLPETNSKTNSKKYKGKSTDSPDGDSFSLTILNNQIDKIMKDNYSDEFTGNLDIDDFKEIFKTFYSIGNFIRGIKPTRLKNQQVMDIIESLYYVSDRFEPCLEDYKLIIEDYFKQDFEDCDYGINHFISGDIILMRCYSLQHLFE